MVQALDFAGTYGVLTLFGLIPAASVWSQRYHNNNRLPAFRVRANLHALAAYKQHRGSACPMTGESDTS